MFKKVIILYFLFLYAIAPTVFAQPLIMGYYTNWGTYKGYPVGNPQLNEQARLLNILAYAFLEVDVNGSLYFSDPWSDLDHRDAAFCAQNRPICKNMAGTEGLGNFSKLTRDKIYPDVKVVISVGGAGHDDSFHNAFNNTKNFIASLRAIIQTYQVAGIDLDFEPSGWTGSDASHYVNLVEEIRNHFPAILITAAVTANPHVIKQFQAENWRRFAEKVDYIGIMAYDFHGGFDGIGNKTAFHSNLYSDNNDPYHTHFSGDLAFKTYREMGVPASKLLLGIPAYGRVMTEIVDGGTKGLYQAIGGAYYKGDLDGEMESYRSIISNWLGKGYTDYWHTNTTGTEPGVLSGVFAYHAEQKIFVAFDNAALVDVKANYVKDHKMGGMMMWELRSDLHPGDNASLLRHMASGN